MTAVLARKMWRTLEPYHGLVYFTPHAAAAYAALGITGQAGYFASRAAPMGPVPAGVVIATFYNFDPRLVRAAVPAVWRAASPVDITAARLRPTIRRWLKRDIGGRAVSAPSAADTLPDHGTADPNFHDRHRSSRFHYDGGGEPIGAGTDPAPSPLV